MLVVLRYSTVRHKSPWRAGNDGTNVPSCCTQIRLIPPLLNQVRRRSRSLPTSLTSKLGPNANPSAFIEQFRILHPSGTPKNISSPDSSSWNIKEGRVSQNSPIGVRAVKFQDETPEGSKGAVIVDVGGQTRARNRSKSLATGHENHQALVRLQSYGHLNIGAIKSSNLINTLSRGKFSKISEAETEKTNANIKWTRQKVKVVGYDGNEVPTEPPGDLLANGDAR